MSASARAASSLPHVNMQTDLTNISDEPEFLGSGGFGQVRKMWWSAGGGLVVAVKELHQRHLSEGALAELRREAEAMYAMRHPNVVQLFGASLISPHTCLAGTSTQHVHS